jgi:hypothetical protein
VDEYNQAVRIAFAWDGGTTSSVPDESEFICPPELATRLIALLTGPDSDVTDGMFFEFAHPFGIRVRTSGTLRKGGDGPR